MSKLLQKNQGLRNSVRYAAICALAGSAWAHPVLGQDAQDVTELGLDQLLNLQVSAASKFPQKLSEAPANVTVITAADIAAFGHRSLSAILNSVPGLHVLTDRNYDFVGVRGFARSGDYNARVLVLVDGYRVNDPVYGAGTIGLEFLVDVDLIDRVEFVHGPGSSIYGSYAFLGVVNVITKKGKQLKGWVASADAGSGEAYKQRLSYGRRFDNGLDLILSGSHYDRDGEDLYLPQFDDPASNNGVARGLDDEDFRSLFSKAAWRGFSLEAAYNQREKGIPTGEYGCVFNDPRCETLDTQSFFQLGYGRVFANGLDLQARAYSGRYDYTGHFPYDDGSGQIIENVDGSRTAWWGGELKGVGTVGDRHSLVVGAEHVHNREVAQFNFDPEPYALYAEYDRPQNTSAAYLQDDVRISRSLNVVAGVRWDDVGKFGDATSPRLAVIYRVTPASTVKLTYGEAFRAPDGYEAYLTQAGIRKPSDLKPENTRNYSLILEHVQEGYLRSSLSIFHNSIDDLIVDTVDPADGLFQFQNVDRAEGDGAELTVERLWGPSIRVRGSYSYQHVRNLNSDAAVTNSPCHLAKLNVALPVPGTGVGAGLEVLYTGSRRTLAGEVGGYVVANLTFRRTMFFPGLTASASAYNLLDKAYAYVARDEQAEGHGIYALDADGRQFRFKLEYAF